MLSVWLTPPVLRARCLNTTHRPNDGILLHVKWPRGSRTTMNCAWCWALTWSCCVEVGARLVPHLCNGADPACAANLWVRVLGELASVVQVPLAGDT